MTFASAGEKYLMPQRGPVFILVYSILDHISRVSVNPMSKLAEGKGTTNKENTPSTRSTSRVLLWIGCSVPHELGSGEPGSVTTPAAVPQQDRVHMEQCSISSGSMNGVPVAVTCD